MRPPPPSRRNAHTLVENCEGATDRAVPAPLSVPTFRESTVVEKMVGVASLLRRSPGMSDRAGQPGLLAVEPVYQLIAVSSVSDHLDDGAARGARRPQSPPPRRPPPPPRPPPSPAPACGRPLCALLQDNRSEGRWDNDALAPTCGARGPGCAYTLAPNGEGPWECGRRQVVRLTTRRTAPAPLRAGP